LAWNVKEDRHNYLNILEYSWLKLKLCFYSKRRFIFKLPVPKGDNVITHFSATGSQTVAVFINKQFIIIGCRCHILPFRPWCLPICPTGKIFSSAIFIQPAAMIFMQCEKKRGRLWFYAFLFHLLQYLNGTSLNCYPNKPWGSFLELADAQDIDTF